MDVENIWNTCPVELLIMIFKLLDSQTLNDLMYTCRRWRDIAAGVVSIKKLWRVLVEENMLDSGKSYKKKSNLNWCGIYMNSLHWYEVKTAEINLENYLDIVVTSFSIYKDNLILVTKDKVIYYNIETFRCVKAFNCICGKYEENDDIIVTTSVAADVVMMKGKHLEMDCESDQNTIAKHSNVMFYSLEGFQVYIMAKNNHIHIYCWRESNWDTILYTRYYGPARIIHSLVHNEEMYILTEGGRSYRTNAMIFAFENYKSSNYSLPSSMIVKGFGLLYKNTKVIFGGTTRAKTHCFYDKISRTIYLECPDLSCVTQHLEILFLGYNSGKVEIGIPLNMVNNNGTPELSFYVKGRRRILDIDVYEEANAHHLFVHTETDISHFKIPCINCSEYCQ